jgi:MOSC domain-containing protein
MPPTVAALHRYPVKSMLGEDLQAAEIDARGVVGDRAYAVIDPAENRVGSAKIPKKWAQLYEFTCVYDGGTDGVLPAPSIAFPDGSVVAADAPDVEARLSAVLGKDVRFVSTKPEGLKLEAVKPGLDAIELAETVDFPLVNPFFDFAALHIVTSATLDHYRSIYPEGDFDARRFRPNIVLATPGESGFLEQTWVGKTLAIGEQVRVRIMMPTHRCAATTLPHHGLPKDNEILRTANRHNAGNVGVYAAVLETGTVRVGDAVEVVG